FSSYTSQLPRGVGRGSVRGRGEPPPPCACTPVVDSALMVKTTAIATLDQMILRRKPMMVLRCRLTVGVTGGDLDHTPVRHDHRLQKSQRTAVPRGEELHRNFVPGVERIRPRFTDTPLREGRGGAECQHPLGCRAIRILDCDTQRPVGIYELYLFDRP